MQIRSSIIRAYHCVSLTVEGKFLQICNHMMKGERGATIIEDKEIICISYP